MEEEKTEETIENPEEEETSEEETSNEDQETSEEKPEASREEDLEAQRDRLYARLKKEEEKRKELELKVNELLEKPSEEKSEKSEYDEIERMAEITATFQGLNSKERAKLIEVSKNQNVPLTAARKHEDFVDWKSGYQARLEKQKAPAPSTKQPGMTPEKPWNEMNRDEQEEWVKNAKVLDPKTGQYKPAQLLPRAFYKPPRQ